MYVTRALVAPRESRSGPSVAPVREQTDDHLAPVDALPPGRADARGGDRGRRLPHRQARCTGRPGAARRLAAPPGAGPSADALTVPCPTTPCPTTPCPRARARLPRCRAGRCTGGPGASRG
ncbi:hypothetical protein GCM10010501_61800 [Streptomyces libani subsp. rufus]|nr:hypothetical protein GCM10010501_61800 [Streptomyces libani subsp. rufus]